MFNHYRDIRASSKFQKIWPRWLCSHRFHEHLNACCSLTTMRRKNTYSHYILLFFHFSLFYFPLWVLCFQLSFATTPCLRVQLESVTASKLQPATTPHLQPTPNHWLPKTSLQGILNFQPISNLGKPPFLQQQGHKGIPQHKGNASNTSSV